MAFQDVFNPKEFAKMICMAIRPGPLLFILGYPFFLIAEWMKGRAGG